MSPFSAVVAAPDDDHVALENAGLDHRIALDLEREVLAAGQHVGRACDIVLWVWMALIGTPAAIRPITGT